MQAVVCELLPQGLHELLPHMMLVVVCIEIVALLLRTIPADGTDVEHARAILDESPSLYGDVEMREVDQTEVDEPLQLVLS